MPAGAVDQRTGGGQRHEGSGRWRRARDRAPGASAAVQRIGVLGRDARRTQQLRGAPAQSRASHGEPSGRPAIERARRRRRTPRPASRRRAAARGRRAQPAPSMPMLLAGHARAPARRRLPRGRCRGRSSASTRRRGREQLRLAKLLITSIASFHSSPASRSTSRAQARIAGAIDGAPSSPSSQGASRARTSVSARGQRAAPSPVGQGGRRRRRNARSAGQKRIGRHDALAARRALPPRDGSVRRSAWQLRRRASSRAARGRRKVRRAPSTRGGRPAEAARRTAACWTTSPCSASSSTRPGGQHRQEGTEACSVLRVEHQAVAAVFGRHRPSAGHRACRPSSPRRPGRAGRRRATGWAARRAADPARLSRSPDQRAPVRSDQGGSDVVAQRPDRRRRRPARRGSAPHQSVARGGGIWSCTVRSAGRSLPRAARRRRAGRGAHGRSARDPAHAAASGDRSSTAIAIRDRPPRTPPTAPWRPGGAERRHCHRNTPSRQP